MVPQKSRQLPVVLAQTKAERACIESYFYSVMDALASENAFNACEQTKADRERMRLQVARVLQTHLDVQIDHPGHRHHAAWRWFRDWAHYNGFKPHWVATRCPKSPLLKVRRMTRTERFLGASRRLFSFRHR